MRSLCTMSRHARKSAFRRTSAFGRTSVKRLSTAVILSGVCEAKDLATRKKAFTLLGCCEAFDVFLSVLHAEAKPLSGPMVRPQTSLGRCPRFLSRFESGLKARSNLKPQNWVGPIALNASHTKALGRCPRLELGRAVGPEDLALASTLNVSNTLTPTT